MLLLGQWDPETAPATNRPHVSQPLLDKEGKLIQLTPKMNRKGPELRSTDKKKLEHVQPKMIDWLKDAVKKHKTLGQNQLNEYYPENDGYPYKFAESKKPEIFTNSME